MGFWVGQDDFDLRGVSEKSELIHRANAFCESIGSKNFSYMLLNPPRNALLKTDPVITNCPTEWLVRYAERDYQFHDPLAKICSRSRLPFRWGHREFLKLLNKAERAVLHEARDFGLVEGYVVPISGPEGDMGGLSFCVDSSGSVADMVSESAARIQLFAAEFHAAAIRVLFDKVPTKAVTLTPREREVLSWAADGLSSEATADRIGLTTPTVNYHIANCCQKLGASNKMHAVAMALRQGLI